MAADVTIGLAFLAGLASFLSPCVLALVPAYVSYLSGRAIRSNQADAQPDRWLTLWHGFAFVLGFSVVFILIGLAASALGALLYDIRNWLARLGGLIVLLFGLHLTGLLRLPFLEYDLRPQSRLDRQGSFVSSFLMGIVFSAGWSPCTGPILGAIATLAMNTANLPLGALLLTAYSLGLAVPFLAAALSIGWVTTALRRYQKLLHFIEIAMGIILIVVGVMMLLGIFQQLALLAPGVDFGL
ncbi:MAG TPA: cytochrome c biogenesis protein CcdA [Anaerolineaceae bacterium]|nr:cytochrome c biogenesis protein CcdA [Anaerolineaceae bacterium]HOD04233.1 cytochrome c biogenesis protein CcdA [Anaerolineaceae bacterium]